MSNHHHVFERSGLAALSDIETPEWRELFSFLEQEQSIFLERESRFRSPEYKWPGDPLYTWSRVWEYPYIFHHLKSWRSKFRGGTLPNVVDVGSGVTFFPFSVARLGCHVICTDIDPICERDLMRAAKCVSHDPGKVSFKLTEGSKLPFSDGEIDAVYCISVLEHIPNFETTIQEMARILKPSGLLFLTIDLDLRGNAEIGVVKHTALIRSLRQYFDFKYQDTTVHPADLLLSTLGPYPMRSSSGLQLVWFYIKQWGIKPLLGRKPSKLNKLYLAVQGAVLELK